MDMITLAMAKAYTDSKQLASAETTLTTVFENASAAMVSKVDTSLVESGTRCVVEFCGETYERTAYVDRDGKIAVGNSYLRGGESDTGEPFCIWNQTNSVYGIKRASGFTGEISLYVKTEIIHTIDPKFIPAMDSLTLNGADGKQYKVTVDANGALVATAI